MIDLERAFHDPASVFHKPVDVLNENRLTHEQKKKILDQWHLDALELMRAEEENMPGDGPSMLSRVERALQMLEEE